MKLGTDHLTSDGEIGGGGGGVGKKKKKKKLKR